MRAHRQREREAENGPKNQPDTGDHGNYVLLLVGAGQNLAAGPFVRTQCITGGRDTCTATSRPT